MFVVFGLLVFLSFETIKYKFLVLILYLLIFYRKNHKYELVCLVFLSLLMLISHTYVPKKLIHHGTVEKVSDYGFTLKSLTYRLYISSDYRVSIGDKISLKGNLNHQDKPSFNRYIGTLSDVEVLKHRNVKTLRGKIYKENKEVFNLLFDSANDSIVTSLGLQIMGLLAIYKLIYNRYIGNAKYESFFLLIISRLFGRTFVWWRLFLNSLGMRVESQIIILLFLFPNALGSPSFLYSYGLYLLSKLTDEFDHINKKILFAQFSLYYFNQWHPLQSLVYPILKYLAGLFTIIVIGSCWFIPFTYIVDLFQTIHSALISTKLYNVLLIRGKMPLVMFIILLFIHSKKDHLILFLTTVILIQYPPYARISYIDVGQGDSTLISLPFNTVHFLVDTGRSFGYRNVKNTLKEHGVKDLDYLILTHDDLDHVENKDRIKQDFKPKQIIEDKQQPIKFMKTHLKERNFSEENENSIILSFYLHGKSYLLLGDAYKSQEKMIVKNEPNFKVDVLKLGHHGSNTSTSDELLKSTEAKYGIISSDPRRYNHPRPEVMRKLMNHRVIPIQTSQEGTIKIVSTPFFQYLKTYNGSFGIMKKGD